jgi:hypothetical protein
MTSSDHSPTADVYAGDTTSLGRAGSNGVVHVFTIEADAEPGTFARIANVLSIANRAPSRVGLELKGEGMGFTMQVELAVGAGTAQSIQRKLAQLTDVIEVELVIQRVR